MNGEELKPCPFDGGKPHTATYDQVQWFVECNSCGVSNLSFPTEAEAIEAWNRRHPLPEQPQEGWRLVPVEITQAMLDATCCDEADDRQMRDAWKALLAAAPTPPSTETKESGE